MVLDGLRGYLQLATGLTDVTRERALAAAKALAAQGEASVEAVVPESVRTQVSALADDLVATSKANRDLLVSLVRAEVERSVARLGLTPGQQTAQPSSPSGGTRTAKRTAKKTTKKATKRTAKKVAKKTAAKKTAKRAVTRSTAKKSTAKTAAKRSAKKSTAKRSASKRAAKTSTAKRSAS